MFFPFPCISKYPAVDAGEKKSSTRALTVIYETASFSLIMGHAECHHENGTRFQQLTSKNPPNFGGQLEKM